MEFSDCPDSPSEEDPDGSDITAVYAQIRRIAKRLLRRERPNHTLQATALANESVARLLRKELQGLTDRDLIIFGVREMQTILIDSGRRYQTRVRSAHEIPRYSRSRFDELVHLQICLERLGACDPRARQVVELRFFVGLSIVETAEFLGMSARTVNGDWEFARTWLAMHWADSPIDIGVRAGAA